MSSRTRTLFWSPITQQISLTLPPSTWCSLATPHLEYQILGENQATAISSQPSTKKSGQRKKSLTNRRSLPTPRGMRRSVFSMRNTHLMRRSDSLFIESPSIPTTTSETRSKTPSLPSSSRGFCAPWPKNYCWIVSSYCSYLISAKIPNGDMRLMSSLTVLESSNPSSIFLSQKALMDW